jgi:hypothetical protein
MTIREITVETAVPPYDIQIVIENEDGSTLTMPKSEYEKQQAEQSTPNLS